MNGALTKADELYASGNIFNPEYKPFLKTLRQLPTCCAESADILIEKRKMFERNDIFPAGVIDAQAAKLRAFNDKGLSDKILGNETKIAELVEKYLHIA